MTDKEKIARLEAELKHAYRVIELIIANPIYEKNEQGKLIIKAEYLNEMTSTMVGYANNVNQMHLGVKARRASQKKLNLIEPIFKNITKEYVIDYLKNRTKENEKVRALLSMIKSGAFDTSHDFAIKPFLAWWSKELGLSSEVLPRAYYKLIKAIPDLKYE